NAVGAHWPQIDSARGAIEIVGETAEMLAEPGDVLRREVGARLDTQLRHLRGAARTDAMEAPYWQALDECGALARPHHAQPVGLVLVAGQLGEKLVVGHSGAGGEAGLLADAPADQLGDA